MTDSILVTLAERVTRLECSFPALFARLERLEQLEQQRTADREQAERGEVGRLRQQLAELQEQTMKGDPT